MHTINKPRNAKGMLKIGRFPTNSLIIKAGKSFAAQTREAILYSKRMENKRLAA